MIPVEVKTSIRQFLNQQEDILDVDHHLLEKSFQLRCTRSQTAFKNETKPARKILEALQNRHGGVFGDPPDTFIIATKEKTLGYLKAQIIQDNILNLISIWVAPEQRGRGIFEAEMKFLCGMADEVRCAVVSVPCPFEPKLVDGSEEPDRFGAIVAANVGDCGAVTKPQDYSSKVEALRVTYLNRGFQPFLWWPAMPFEDEDLRSKAVTYVPESFDATTPEGDELKMLIECMSMT